MASSSANSRYNKFRHRTTRKHLEKMKKVIEKVKWEGTTCGKVIGGVKDDDKCKRFESQPLHIPNCTQQRRLVPKNLFVVYSTALPYLVRANAAANAHYKLHAFNDSSAGSFIRKHCGVDAYDAYQCLKAPAYRADLFRFCALASKGGVYMDSDLALVRPIDSIVSVCSNATIGADWDQEIEHQTYGAKQMKVLASAPQSRITVCMLKKIISNVRNRFYGVSSLQISGPVALEECYREGIQHTRGDVVITYIDTRGAIWPYTGLRTQRKLFAFEAPNEQRHWGVSASPASGTESRVPQDIDYSKLYALRQVYDSSCRLR